MHKSVSYFLHEHKYARIIMIQTSFLALSFLALSVFWYFNELKSSQDLIFNYQRIEEVWHDISNLRLPQFNQSTSLPYGLATPTMYPWLLLAPFMVLVPFFNTIHLMLLIYTIILYVGLNIAFYASFRCNFIQGESHKLIKSYLFACLYMISEMSVCEFEVSDIGALCEMALLPLVFFGWTQWIRHGSYKEMLTGLILISWCHIMGIAISLGFLILFTFIFHRHILISRWKNIIYIGIIFLLGSAITWVPILALGSHQDISGVQVTSGISSMYIPKAFDSLLSIIGVVIYPSVISGHVFTDFLGYILCGCFFKRLPRNLKHLYICSLIILILDYVTVHIGSLSYVMRAYILAHLFIAIVLSYLLVTELPRFYHTHHNIIFGVIVLILSLINTLGGERLEVQEARLSYPFRAKINQWVSAPKHAIEYNLIYDKKKFTDNDLNSQELIHLQSHYDYFPIYYKRTYANANSVIIGKHILKVRPQNNGVIKFHTNKYHSKVDVPIAVYKGQESIIKLDRHRTHWSLSKSGSVQLHNVYKGNHRVQIIEPIMWYRWLSYVLSIIGIMILAIDEYKHRDTN